MSTDFEKQLRERITGAGDHAGVEVDLDRVLDGGHVSLARRDRRRVGIAGALAALALVAGGSVYTLGTDRTEPAAPAATSATSAVGNEAVLDIESQVPGRPASLHLTPHGVPGGDVQVSVQAHSVTGATGKPATVTLPAGRQSAALLDDTLVKACRVTVVRGEASDISLVTRQTAGTADHALDLIEAGMEPAYLPEADVTVQVGCEEPNGNSTAKPTGTMFDHVLGELWMTRDGVVHDSSGKGVSSVTFTAHGAKSTAFHSTALHTMGLMEPTGAVWREAPAGQPGWTMVQSHSSGDILGHTPGTAFYTTSVLFVPGEVREARATAGDVQQLSSQVLRASDGSTFVVATTQKAQDSFVSIDHTWTGADGRTHTIKG